MLLFEIEFYTTPEKRMTFTQLLALVQSGGIRVCADSRQVQPGDCFVAIRGVRADGHQFIPTARQRGARYIVAEQPSNDGDCVFVENSAEALGLLAQAAWGNPNSQMTNLAVTGTNGKTTTAYLVRSVIETAGASCALIGTIVYSAGSMTVEAPLTTPDALTLAQTARQALDSGARYMMVEASSHALSQQRLAGIAFTAAAFTNLTGDHLDYHKTSDNYLTAKASLFENLPPHGMAVLNAQSEAAKAIAARIKRRILWYAIEQTADVIAHIHRMDDTGSEFSIQFGGVMEKVVTPLCGMHNISNHLAAAGLSLAAGFSLSAISQGLSALQYVPGRLEPVASPMAERRGLRVFVDYAHTDDALANVLTTLRPICRGRLWVVFGCGGDRDKTKRPRMARAAETLADEVIVTSDNPRTEDPQTIIEEICAGFSSDKRNDVFVEPDRKKAIFRAVSQAQHGDVVLIAGKGHETYQIIGTKKHNFSDVLAAQEALACL
jgi:UDP-N-acetylmuramoyl-L-alanyl-D-glutamate--2,6-diaminopimelate ligase